MKKIRFYFTLEELTQFIAPSQDTRELQFKNAYKTFLNDHKADDNSQRYLTIDYDTADYGTGTEWLKKTSDKLLNRIYFEHANDYLIAIDVDVRGMNLDDIDEDNLLTEAEAVLAMRKINNVYLNSYKRYTALLKAYEDESSTLIANLNKTRKATFNDTPQNGGDYADDEHISTIEHEVESIPEGIIIERLGKLDELYKNTMNDWLREFDMCFMYEGENDYE